MRLNVVRDRKEFLLLSVSGRLDADGVQQVDADFKAEISSRGKPTLVDMSEVDFLGSLGIGMLLAGAQILARSGSRLGLFGVRPIVREALEIARLDRHIPMADTFTEAVRRIKKD